MKNLFVRLSVLALALTGFTASTVATTHIKKDRVSFGGPGCWPGKGAGTACGMPD